MMRQTINVAPPQKGWRAVSMLVMVVLRTVIGWHFLYEGLVKLSDPSWSAKGYLENAQWLGADWFHSLAANPDSLRLVDLMNIWGLILIGVGLMLGFFSRLASFSGVILLLMYYAANPSLIDAGRSAGAEGNYLLIDKNLVELFALLALTFVPTGRFLGVDGFIRALFGKRTIDGETAGTPRSTYPDSVGRREWLRHFATIPAFGGFIYAYQKRHGWETFEVKNLLDRRMEPSADAKSGATSRTFEFAKVEELKGKVPHAKILNMELSRMVLGGNLIGGWAHARDLIYVSNLVQAYHTDAKVFETFRLAELCGVNTIITNPKLCRVINDYWKKEGGKIQFISDCGGEVMKGVRVSIDNGASSGYIQGATADNLVKAGDFDTIVKALDLIRQNGLPAGIGAHFLETVQACVDKGIKPDYWMKTLHSRDYWSAQSPTENDNTWCADPIAVAAYMEQLEQPWIAFKVMAAGALRPNDAFPFAFKSGADFICAGMYDFQLVDNTNLVIDVLNNVTDRKRPWRA